MRHEALFTFHTPEARIIAASLIPESDGNKDGRSCGVCRLGCDDFLEIRIRAEDLTALRAAINTWLRLVQIAEEMVLTTKKATMTNE